MTASQIQEALRLAESALRSVKESERWALVAASNDKSGSAYQAWQCAKQAMQELEKLKRQLQSIPPS